MSGLTTYSLGEALTSAVKERLIAATHRHTKILA
jgi:hypothetical protein